MTTNVISLADTLEHRHRRLWKIIERDLDAYFNGAADCEKGNVGRAMGFGLYDEVESVKACWAEARQIHAQRQQEREQQQQEGEGA